MLYSKNALCRGDCGFRFRSDGKPDWSGTQVVHIERCDFPFPGNRRTPSPEHDSDPATLPPTTFGDRQTDRSRSAPDCQNPGTPPEIPQPLNGVLEASIGTPVYP